VLYVQGMGRGTRISDGKTDCLVLDFTDTVERLGPVDTIQGRAKKKSGTQEAPYSICPDCGERNSPAALVCIHCGGQIREAEDKQLDAKVSYAALLSSQTTVAELVWHDITKVGYAMHRKEGKPDSLRVDYYTGLLRVASEWVCFNHIGYPKQKAQNWWLERDKFYMPTGTQDALDYLQLKRIDEPVQIATRKNGKYTEVKQYEFSRTERHQEASGQPGQTTFFDSSKLPTVQQLQHRHLQTI
jgi:DNA repair protein RadD